MLTNTNKIANVLVVNSQPIFRHGITSLLNQEADMHVCCQANSAEHALSGACGRHDVAVVDMSLADNSGLGLVRKLLEKFPLSPVLMLSAHDDPNTAERALKAGAHGYMLKQDETDTLATAIRHILQGQLYVSNSLRSRMLHNMMQVNTRKSPVSALTPAEFEILHLTGMGLTTRKIATQLSRSIKTVDAHRARIREKLALADSAALTIFAAKWVSTGDNTAYAE
jgi:DNA-binding NarL/FixJ family response regulator